MTQSNPENIVPLNRRTWLMYEKEPELEKRLDLERAEKERVKNEDERLQRLKQWEYTLSIAKKISVERLYLRVMTEEVLEEVESKKFFPPKPVMRKVGEYLAIGSGYVLGMGGILGLFVTGASAAVMGCLHLLGVDFPGWIAPTAIASTGATLTGTSLIYLGDKAETEERKFNDKKNKDKEILTSSLERLTYWKDLGSTEKYIENLEIISRDYDMDVDQKRILAKAVHRKVVGKHANRGVRRTDRRIARWNIIDAILDQYRQDYDLKKLKPEVIRKYKEKYETDILNDEFNSHFRDLIGYRINSLVECIEHEEVWQYYKKNMDKADREIKSLQKAA